ncbi:hypothetical protein [Cupriavidus metallidurans]
MSTNALATTEADITPQIARELRKASGLTQRNFWQDVGSNQASGHWFENDKRKSIPRPIRILIFLRYIAGIDVNVSTPDQAAKVVRVGQDVAAQLAANDAAEKAKRATREAKELAKKARRPAAVAA